MVKKHTLRMNNAKNILYKEIHSMYIKKCTVNNISPHTITNYNSIFKIFNSFVDLEILKCNEINGDLIDEFKLFLRNRDITDTTIHSYVKWLRVIIKYGISLGYIPSFTISDYKTTEKIKIIYTEQELKLLLKKPSRKSFGVYRNWVIINTLLATGIRSLELLSLKVQDLDFENDLLLISRTKNKHQRYVPIASMLRNILGEYLNIRGGQSDDYLFPNSYGQQLPSSTLRINIIKYHRSRGVMKTSIHLYRHTFATMYLKNGGDIHTLAKLLGHTSLKQVQTYLSLTNEDIRENFNSINPLDRLSKKYNIKLK